MVGKICWSIFPFYDSKNGKNSFKKRPVLIISGPKNNDYTVLPVSTISIKQNIDSNYDIKIEPNRYPELGLSKICYVRTHKQTIVHKAAVTSVIGNLKETYEDLYLEILTKLDEFNKKVMNEALA